MSGRRIIVSRAVSEPMQQAFAAFSRDINPMHVDALAARRTQAGRTVVHGIHTLLWGLESLLTAGLLTLQPTRMRVKMPRWIYVGEVADVTVDSAVQHPPARFSVEVKGLTVLSVDLTFGAEGAAPTAASDGEAGYLDGPRDRSLEALEGARGEAFVASSQACAVAFPGLSKLLGARCVAEIAACSYVVGMECPGLHSMFSKADLTLEWGGEHAGLGYELVSLDERFRKARIAVSGATLHGTLEAFVRMPPTAQATLEQAAKKVSAGEFAGMRALILGGSRGLGEAAAKLVVAGGGEAVITFAVGRVDAASVVDEIHAWGGKASAIAYDVQQAAGPQLAGLRDAPSHVLYFATNPIFEQRYQVFAPDVFAAFLQFYVHGFHDLCVALSARPDAARPLVAYYPSSVAVEDRPSGMTEYAMAKAAGEMLCEDMNQSMPGIRIVSTRLPRLATDQTASVVPTLDADPLDTLVPILREMMSLSGKSE